MEWPEEPGTLARSRREPRPQAAVRYRTRCSGAEGRRQGARGRVRSSADEDDLPIGRHLLVAAFKPLRRDAKGASDRLRLRRHLEGVAEIDDATSSPAVMFRCRCSGVMRATRSSRRKRCRCACFQTSQSASPDGDDDDPEAHALEHRGRGAKPFDLVPSGLGAEGARANRCLAKLRPRTCESKRQAPRRTGTRGPGSSRTTGTIRACRTARTARGARRSSPRAARRRRPAATRTWRAAVPTRRGG